MTTVLVIAAAAVAVVLLYYWLTDRHPLEALFDAIAGLFGGDGIGSLARQAVLALLGATLVVVYFAGEGTPLVSLVLAILVLAAALLVLFNVLMVVALRRLLRPDGTGR